MNYKDYIATKGNLTAKEILQQPEMWLKTSEIIKENEEKIGAFFKKFENKKIRICFAGAGTSAFLGEIMSAALGEILGIKAEALHTTDIVSAPKTVLFNEPTLLISFGRSGNSPESVGAIEYARELIDDLYEIAITCAKDGELNKITKGDKCLSIVLPEETCDLGFAMTSSITSMGVAAYGLFKNDFYKDIRELSDKTASVINEYADYAKFIVEGFDFKRAVYLGSGINKGMSHEAMLKMCELTKGVIDIAYDSPTGFRHGPKSMINDETISVHFISNNSLTRKYDIDLLKEMIGEKKGNKILLAADENIEGTDYFVKLPKFSNDFLSSVNALVFAQLLSFFKSQKMGVATDNPCPSGEVNRVVQGVKIYPYEKV